MEPTIPEELVKHGLHFGHKVPRVHPQAKPYIWKNEGGNSIIDLFQTAALLDRALEFIHEQGQKGKRLLVVATKKQAQDIVSELCKKHSVLRMTNKWVGGFITNFDEISKNIKRLKHLEKEKNEGEWDKFPKHEVVGLNKRLSRIRTVYEGVIELDRLPDLVFLIDIKREQVALKEARQAGIPTVAVVDTNCNPTLVDYPIPANDDAVSSIKYLAERVVAAYVEGREKRKKEENGKSVKQE